MPRVSLVVYLMRNEVKEKGKSSWKGINLGKSNGLWKGNKVGYFGLHTWVRRHLAKPTRCQLCKKDKTLEVCNISQKYKRNLSDWEWLCRSCHMKKDGRAQKLAPKRQLICLSSGMVFNSAKEAAKSLQIHEALIARCARGERRRTHGLTFQYIK